MEMPLTTLYPVTTGQLCQSRQNSCKYDCCNKESITTLTCHAEIVYRALSRNIETIALDTLYELIAPLRQPFRLTPEVNPELLIAGETDLPPAKLSRAFFENALVNSTAKGNRLP
ncbi:MAG: hypothetical protein J6I40_01150 [Mailhella sp.]|nr:hypothetical protein [Mailhella sp.]